MGYMLILWAFIIGWQPFNNAGSTFSQRDLIQIGLAVLVGIAGVVVILKDMATEKDRED